MYHGGTPCSYCSGVFSVWGLNCCFLWRLLKALQLIYHSHESTSCRTKKKLCCYCCNTLWIVELCLRDVPFLSWCMQVWYFGGPPWAWLQTSVKGCTAESLSLTIKQQSAGFGFAIFRAIFAVLPSYATLTRSSSFVVLLVCCCVSSIYRVWSICWGVFFFFLKLWFFFLLLFHLFVVVFCVFCVCVFFVLFLYNTLQHLKCSLFVN